MKKYREEIILLLLLVIFFFYASYEQKKVNQNGLIGVCFVSKFEANGTGNGVSLYIDIFYNNKIFKVVLDKICDGTAVVGQYFFVKFNPLNINEFSTIYCEKPIPSCFDINRIKYRTWKEIPNCN